MFQHAPRRRAHPALPIRHRRGRARLRDAGGAGRPVILVPSLINPASILDHGSGRSLARWLADRGHHVLLLDWGTPEPLDREVDLAGHVEQLLLPLIARLEVPPVLVGYCLGGTLAIGAASAAEVAGCATIAAPWRFAGYGAARDDMLAGWRAVEPACATLGLAPMEVLQAGFWQLDPAGTIAKFERFGTLDPGSDDARSFVQLEDWANAGAPLTLSAARELFERLVGEDATGQLDWRVGEGIVDPVRLACPTIQFVSLTDRIVPSATALDGWQRRDIAAGHVGMMVGRRAEAALWQPLADWIASLPHVR